MKKKVVDLTLPCLERRVKYEKLREVHFFVQIAENHPLLKEDTFDLRKLKEYPYVTFVDLEDKNTMWMPWDDLVNPNKVICVQSTSSRVAMVSNTQVFSIVLLHSQEYNKKNHAVWDCAAAFLLFTYP